MARGDPRRIHMRIRATIATDGAGQSLNRSHVIVVRTSSPSLFFVTGGFRISRFLGNSTNR
jgi:hypothetical protein